VVNGLSNSGKANDIGGYTLLFDSFGIHLEKLKAFTTRENAIKEMSDVVLSKEIVEHSSERKTVGDTDYGKKIKKEIARLIAQLD